MTKSLGSQSVTYSTWNVPVPVRGPGDADHVACLHVAGDAGSRPIEPTISESIVPEPMSISASPISGLLLVVVVHGRTARVTGGARVTPGATIAAERRGDEDDLDLPVAGHVHVERQPRAADAGREHRAGEAHARSTRREWVRGSR